MEFGIVALPFFALMFAIFEIGLVFVTSSVLENAVVETSRLIRTGQASNRNFDAAGFKAEMCGRMSIFAGDCESRANIDVREVPKFSSSLPDPLADGEMNKAVLVYQGGQPGSLMVVRAWYDQPVITPFLTRAVDKGKGGKTILTVTTAFRNEPWGWGSGTTP